MTTRMVQPLADEVGEGYLAYVTDAAPVALTQPLAELMAFCRTEGARPILVTGPRAQLSVLVAVALRASGGFWVMRDGDGAVYDATSGWQIDSFSQLWAPPTSQERRRHPAFGPAAVPPAPGVLMLDVVLQSPARAGVRTGDLAAHLVAELGGGGLVRWDVVEPLLQPWAAEAVTETARRGEVSGLPILARAAGGGHALISVRPLARGVLERITVGVPVPPGETGGPGALAAQLLAQLQTSHPVTLARAWLCDRAAGGAVAARGHAAEVPLAALVGGRSLKGLGMDLTELARRHQVRRAGGWRSPQALITLRDPDPELWSRLSALAFDLELAPMTAGES